MRSLIVGAAALLAVSVTTPALAAPLSVFPTAAASTVQSLPTDGATSVLATTTKKKKKKKTTTTKAESASIENIASVRRGEKGFQIITKVAKTDRVCSLKVKWNDGTTETADDVDADKSKECTSELDVPSGRDAVGTATATVTVKDSKGKKVATAKKTFTVK